MQPCRMQKRRAKAEQTQKHVSVSKFMQVYRRIKQKRDWATH